MAFSFNKKSFLSLFLSAATILCALLLLYLPWRQQLQLFLFFLLILYLFRVKFTPKPLTTLGFIVIFLISFTTDITAFLYFKKAEVFYANSKNKDALSYCKIAASINSRNPLYRIRLADYYAAMGSYQEAINEYLRLEKYSLHDITTKAKLIGVYIKTGQLKEGAAEYEKLIKISRYKILTYDEKCRLIDLHKQLIYRIALKEGFNSVAERNKNNLLRNGDFSVFLNRKDMPAGWVKSTPDLKTFLLNDSDAKNIFKITNWRSNDRIESYPVKFEKKRNYCLSFLLKIEAKKGGFYVQWNAFKENYEVLKYATLASFLSDIPQWQKIELMIDSSIFPKGTECINIMLKWYDSGCSDCGAAYIKDMFLQTK